MQLIIKELFKIVWDNHWATERYIESGHAREVEKLFNSHIKNIFGDKDLSEVTRLVVKQWHTSLLKTPFAANRSLEVLSKMFSYAIIEGLFEGANPCFSIKAHTEKSRNRYATKDELERIGKAFNKYFESHPVQVTFLRALLFSGARPKFLLKAKWQDITIFDGYGRLTCAGKSTAETGDAETVLLPPVIMEEINKLPRRKDGLVFGVGLPKDLWYKIRDESGCPDLWIRDFRRTFATTGLGNKITLDVIGELLNHKSTQTTKRYAKLNDDARVAAVSSITDKMTQLLMGIKNSA